MDNSASLLEQVLINDKTDESSPLSTKIPGNARYLLKKTSGRIISELKGKELRCLGHHGFIDPEDLVQKSGEEVWQKSKDVLGLLINVDTSIATVNITEESTSEVKDSKELEQLIANQKPYKQIKKLKNKNVTHLYVKNICLAYIDERRATKAGEILYFRRILTLAYEKLSTTLFRTAWFKLELDSQILLLNSIRLGRQSREKTKARKKAELHLAKTPELLAEDFFLFRRITHAIDGLKTLNPYFKTEYGRLWEPLKHEPTNHK